MEIIGLIVTLVGIIWFFIQKYMAKSAETKKRRVRQAQSSMDEDTQALAESVTAAERRKKDREIEDKLLGDRK